MDHRLKRTFKDLSIYIVDVVDHQMLERLQKHLVVLEKRNPNDGKNEEIVNITLFGKHEVTFPLNHRLVSDIHTYLPISRFLIEPNNKTDYFHLLYTFQRRKTIIGGVLREKYYIDHETVAHPYTYAHPDDNPPRATHKIEHLTDLFYLAPPKPAPTRLVDEALRFLDKIRPNSLKTSQKYEPSSTNDPT